MSSAVSDLLPGLYVAVLAALLLAALRRGWDAVPGWVAAAFGLLLVALFGRVLFRGEILLPLDNLRGEAPFRQLAPMVPHGNLIQGDLIQLIAPSNAEVRRAFAEGRLPFWNDRVGAGMPLLADPQAQVLQPLVLLALPFSLGPAAGVTGALRVLLALVFTFLSLRRLDLGQGAALCGALGFGLGGFVLLWLGWPMANSAAWLPAVLYGVVLLDLRGARRDALLLGLALFGLLQGGHPETIAYALVLALAFGAARALGRPKDTRRPFAVRASWVLALSLGVSAPTLLPAALYLPHSARAMREAARFGEPPTAAALSARAIPLVAPNAQGNSRYLDYWGPNNTNEDASGFVGTILLLGALLAALPARRRFPQELLLLGSAALALGGAVVLGRPRLFFIAAFAVAGVGAMTVERFTQGSRGESSRLAAIAIGLGLAGAIAWAYVAHPYPGDPERMAIFRFGWLRWQLRFLGAGLVILVLARGRRFLPFLLAPLLAAELFLIHGPANPPMPKRLLFPTPPAIRFLQSHTEGGERVAALGRALPPNLATLYGLRDLRIYNPAMPAAWENLVAPLVAGRKASPGQGEVPAFGRPLDPLYPRLGVRFLLSEPGTTLPPPLSLVFADPTARIWEVADPVPLLFAAGRLEPEARLAIERLSPASLRIEVPPVLRNEAWHLSSGILDEGGWRVRASGRPVATRRELGALLSAEIPSGTERIEISYRPPGLLAGCLLAALALLLAAYRAAAFRGRAPQKAGGG
ncbi:MAG: YfhO family protein [Acidobacteriota bacterium]